MERKTTILTITGSDSTGGSGIQADIKTITMLGAYAATAITSVTAQDSEGIQQLYDIPAEVLNLQICAVLNDLKPNAVKIGMLRNVEQVIAVEHLLRKYKPEFVVLDAVIISSSGKMLMPNEVVNAVVQRLFPLSSIVIMQQNSAAYMLHEKETHSNEALELLARKILQLGSAAVVLQGGIVTKASFTDVLVEKNKTAHFYTRPGFIDRITHGSGGAFTSAVAVNLCAGNSVEQAIGKASDYMCQLILRSADSNFGTNVLLLDHSSDLPQQTISERMLELYNQLMDNIAANHRKTGEVRFYADALNVTPRYLAQITRRVAGRTPKQLIDDYIIKEVETYLIGTTQNIQEIAFTFGFSSQVQFNKFFKKMKGCAPGQYRKKAKSVVV